ncbi:MAG: cupin domain-containing protein [Alphaproteobacteria bacterium]|nr:cupin domain-containing protein [Alphaproteobacteria bacterium]
MNIRALLCSAAASVVLGAAGPMTNPSQPAPTAAPMADMQVVNGLAAVKWGPAHPALPPGAQTALMAGDPAGTGFVSIRAKMPAGYKVPPHFHPTDEHVTVLSGTMAFGMGDMIDAKSAKTVNRGGYFAAPANMHHYAMAKTAAVIQIDFMGPFGITYVNPGDDPRHPEK